MQAAVLALCFTWLAGYGAYVSMGFTVLSAILVIHIINSKSNPAMKIAWIIPMLVVPVFGGLIYLFFHAQPGAKAKNRRIRKIQKYTAHFTPQSAEVKEKLTAEDPKLANLSGYLYKFGGYPTYENTELRYFPSGEEKFAALIPELEKAQKFIFLEYFILEEGYMWDTVLEILLEDKKNKIVIGQSPLGDELNYVNERIQIIKDYPNAKYFKGLDLAVSACGYNSFHELLYTKVPTVFLPNTKTGTDDQVARALRSEAYGLGAVVTEPTRENIAEAVQKMMQSNIVKEDIVLDFHGATEAANVIMKYHNEK